MNEESQWQKKEEEKDKPRIRSVKPVSQSMQYREREQLLMFSNAHYHAVAWFLPVIELPVMARYRCWLVRHLQSLL